MNASGDLRLRQGAEPGVTALPQVRVARVLLSVVMVTLASACLSCGPGRTSLPATLTPEEHELRARDFQMRLDARLLEAEQQGFVNPGAKSETLPLWRLTGPPALLGYVRAISADSLSIHTFASADPQNYFAGDVWTFKFTPGTNIFRWLLVFISPQDLRKGEIVRVILIQGTMNLESVRGFGVTWP
jgi:hypothetical protein